MKNTNKPILLATASLLAALADWLSRKAGEEVNAVNPVLAPEPTATEGTPTPAAEQKPKRGRPAAAPTAEPKTEPVTEQPAAEQKQEPKPEPKPEAKPEPKTDDAAAAAADKARYAANQELIKPLVIAKREKEVLGVILKHSKNLRELPASAQESFEQDIQALLM